MSDSQLKAQLKSDLTTSMKARDQVRSATIRMALTAITNEEVAGKSSRELSDSDVLTVLAKEAKKRRESEVAYREAGRPELADREEAERAVLEEYLPTQLSDTELAAIVTSAIASSGASGMQAMGQVMKLVQPQLTGRAEGGRVAAEVKQQLAQN